MRLLKLLSVLLDYPRDELWLHREELLAAAEDRAALPPRRIAELRAFIEALLARDPLDAQSEWLRYFDRGRTMSLLLFEHIHGDSRDRGQAMVDLVETYRRQGFELSRKELPDYLPLLLEYLSQQPEAEIRDWLRHIAHIIALLAARAAERGSPHALALTILCELADGQADSGRLRERARAESRDDSPEAMDRLWEEEAVRFGTPAVPETQRADPVTNGMSMVRQVQP